MLSVAVAVRVMVPAVPATQPAALGAVVSGTGLLMAKLTTAEVPMLPAAS